MENESKVTVTMEVRINRKTETARIVKQADGTEKTITEVNCQSVYEQTVTDLDVADVIAVVNKLAKKPDQQKLAESINTTPVTA